MCCVFTSCRYGDDLDALEEEGDEGEAGGEAEDGTGLSRFGRRRRDGADEDDEGQEEDEEGEEKGEEDGGRSAKKRQQQQLSAEELELMYTSANYQPRRRMGSLDTAAIPGVEV